MLSYLYIALKIPNQIFLDSLWSVVSSGAIFSYVSLLFVKVLVWFHILCLKDYLMCNFLLESDKIVKLVLLALYPCLVSMIIFLDLFSYVCMPFLIYLVLFRWKLIYLWLIIGKYFYCKSNFLEFLVMFSAWSF